MLISKEAWVQEKVENLLYLDEISDPKETYNRLYWEIGDVVSVEEFLAITEELFEKRIEQKVYIPPEEYKSVPIPQQRATFIPPFKSHFFCKFFICRGRSQENRQNTPIFFCALDIEKPKTPYEKARVRDITLREIQRYGVGLGVKINHLDTPVCQKFNERTERLHMANRILWVAESKVCKDFEMINKGIPKIYGDNLIRKRKEFLLNLQGTSS